MFQSLRRGQHMAKTDQLTRFFLKKTLTRGVIIQVDHIKKEAAKLHQLHAKESDLFAQVLAGSILLLSISKGGIRQVMQLDGQHGTVRRIASESRQGAVRGYINWGEKRDVQHADLSALGSSVQLSTIRDSGAGQPYVSTVACPEKHLADALLHYSRQSVQIQADFLLHKNTAIMLEAMPTCSEEQWHESLQTLATISNQSLEKENVKTILTAFDTLNCRVLGQDDYRYQCHCKAQTMFSALKNLDSETLSSLEDEHGKVTLSCQYCAKQYHLDSKETEELG